MGNKTIEVNKINSLLGLMFRDKITPIYFETRFGIHTFFVKHSIDVVVLDRDWVVRKIVKSMKPFRVLFWNPKYFRVIEGPIGTVEKAKIKMGEKISIKQY